ncbi:hydrolase [Paractinoplanes abujensis]|uniref:Pimeloyl-ACP methyl ester carboxylesterase n=1 Tax=Paractinoplanes abujensis TaxID=882441 RepID=A0A7W7CNP3_9ACTN|nr:alpha/beta fold hydrolase [Actinoplanes abujensis]MBB4691902.1 pimeloyl-ACP methyl ester carboxylesterase [Actinoplanes abujensis]GID16677.1 hydrolase [Actinoplanes abujensis]
MRFHREGSGSPLVLVHGLGSRWQVWKPVLPALAGHFDVIAVDLPGFGESPPDGGRGDVPHFADRVAGLLDELGVPAPAVGGSSLGGGVALELGRRGIARSVTAFSPVGFYGAAGAKWCQAVVGLARRGGAALGPALPGLLRTRAGRAALCGIFYAKPLRLAPADGLADARALVAAPGFAEACRELGRWRYPGGGPDGDAGGGVPVTIAWGTRDIVLSCRQAARARRLLPRARHVSLPGCGHLPFSDDPDACARLLIEAA